jgi:hypothetical protein
LWLRKAFHEVSKVAEENLPAPKNIFTDADAVGRFGAGKNMVSSIRHWAIACDIIQEHNDGYNIGEIGDFLFGKESLDPYLEQEASIWLIHWLLAGKADRSATWYVVFNFIQNPTFEPNNVMALLRELTKEDKLVRSETTLHRDIEVCLRSYVSASLRHTTEEDSAEPLLVDLGLLTMHGKNTYRFNRGPQYSLPDEIFSYALLAYWERWEKARETSQATLSFNSIAHDYGSPGRVFKLDEASVADRLSKIYDITTGFLDWTDSHGIRQVSRSKEVDVKEAMRGLLRRAYD